MPHFIINPILQLVLWLHLALSPIQVIQVNAQSRATVLEVLSTSHVVKTAFVCVSDKDIECVDGVCNNRKVGRYWTIEVNDGYQDVNSQTVIGPEDRVVLKYSFLRGK